MTGDQDIGAVGAAGGGRPSSRSDPCPSRIPAGRERATISVICPVHDTEPHWLEAAIRSVLVEPADSVAEVVVVDDASQRAETVAALARLATVDSRIMLLRAERNRGPGAARNIGIAAARSPWIAFLDSDDLWVPGRDQVLSRALAVDPEAAWIAGTRQHLLPTGQVQTCSVVAEFATLARPVATGVSRAEGPALTRFLMGTPRLHLAQVVLRRDVLGAAPFDAQRKMLGEDTLFFVRLSTRAPLVMVDRPVFQLRVDIPSITRSSFALERGDTDWLRTARRLPELRPFRRELRWALYSAEKTLAASNLAYGNAFRALRAALRAWLLDPRELGDLIRFLRLWLVLDETERVREFPHYTAGKIFTVLRD